MRFPQLLAVAALVVSTSAGAKSTLPMVIEQNLALVEVRVGRSPPLTFVLDTGAANTVIATGRARDAGLQAATQSVAATTQGGEIEAQRIAGVTLRIGHHTIKPAAIYAIDLAGLSASVGRKIDGILGQELFHAFTVQMDYDRRRLTLYRRDEWRPIGATLPIELKDDTPFVSGQFAQAGRTLDGSLLLDSGATGALTIYAEFVAAHPELVPAGAIPLSAGALMPGQFHASAGRLDRLALGSIQVDRPVVYFSSSAGVDDAQEGAAGQIGGELLSRFRVTYDYAHLRVELVPGRRIGAGLDFDASGMSLIAIGSDLSGKRIRQVLPNTPAAEAGLQPGDDIIVINGKPASAVTLPQIRTLLRRPDLTVRLTVRRDGRMFETTVRTRTVL